MDAPGVDPAELSRGLAFIRRINRCLGYTIATIRRLGELTGPVDRSRVLRILDIATGSGDVPSAVLRWADRCGQPVEIVGVDLHRLTCRHAKANCPDSRFTVLQCDALNLPFEPGSFDVCLCSMFLHHLDDEPAIELLRSMDRIARNGIIAADLARSVRALAWIKLLTLASGRLVRHDAIVSVRQSFSAAEADVLRERAGLDYARVTRHFGHRWIISGRRK